MVINKKNLFFVCLIWVGAFILATQAFAFDPNAATYKGFIRVRPDRELYVDYVKAKPGQQTVILLNGLTYSTRQFEAYATALQRRGLGVLRFDFDGMGQTLLRYSPSFSAYMYDQQARDLRSLVFNMGIPGPYHLSGLSYGGGIAAAFGLMFPQDVGSLILIAPFTQPLESQDTWIRSQIWLTRRMFPANPATDDQLYDFFLRQIVYSTYPQAEPVVLENPYKLEATYNLARGIRHFRAIDFADKLPAGTVHLMVAGMDQYIPPLLLENFWTKMSPQSKMSRIIVMGSEHKMTEAVPEFVAAWTYEIVRGNPNLYKGFSFEGYPQAMSARSGTVQIQLTR